MCPQFYRGAYLKPKIIILVNYKTYQCLALFLLTNAMHKFYLSMPNTFWQRQQRMLALRDTRLMQRKNSQIGRIKQATARQKVFPLQTIRRQIHCCSIQYRNTRRNSIGSVKQETITNEYQCDLFVFFRVSFTRLFYHFSFFFAFHQM